MNDSSTRFMPLLRRRVRSALELFLLPGLIAVLPWPLGLRVAHRVARWAFLYRSEVELATAEASRLGFAAEPAAFAKRVRLRLLVDVIDGYQTVLRGDRYVRRWVEVRGDPLPESGPLLFAGLHHGCGFWFLPAMRLRKLGPSIIAPRVDHLTSNSGRLEATFLRLRLRLISRAAGKPLVHRGGAADGLGAILSAGGVGFGLPDIPTSRPDAVTVEIAGLRCRLAQGLYEIALKQSAPIYFFTTDTDLDSGQRWVLIQRCGATDAISATREYARFLSDAIERDPTGWRFWTIVRQLLVATEVVGQASSEPG